MPVSTYCDIKRQNMESRPRLSARRLRAAWTVKPLPVPLALVHPPLFPWESASYYRNSQTLIAEFCKKKTAKGWQPYGPMNASPLMLLRQEPSPAC